MKKTILFLVTVLLISSNGRSLAQQFGQIGVYIDEDHSKNCYWGATSLYTSIELWIWCLPGENGMVCADYKLFSYSYGDFALIPLYEIANPAISYESGNLWNGTSVCFCECQYNWVWTHRHLILLYSSGPANVGIEKHPDYDNIQFTTCVPGYPKEQANMYPYFCINDDWCCYG